MATYCPSALTESDHSPPAQSGSSVTWVIAPDARSVMKLVSAWGNSKSLGVRLSALLRKATDCPLPTNTGLSLGALAVGIGVLSITSTPETTASAPVARSLAKRFIEYWD